MIKLLALVLVAAVLFLGVRCVAVHKELLAGQQSIDADWNEVDAALQHRAALTGDLAQVVKSQAPAEQPAIAALDDACRQLLAAGSRLEKMQANARLDHAIGALLLRVEMYPKLDKSKKYGDVLEALKNAEYQIAESRRKYNEAVEHYNARLELFPGNLTASLYGLHKVDAYFQTPVI